MGTKTRNQKQRMLLTYYCVLALCVTSVLAGHSVQAVADPDGEPQLVTGDGTFSNSQGGTERQWDGFCAQDPVTLQIDATGSAYLWVFQNVECEIPEQHDVVDMDMTLVTNSGGTSSFALVFTPSERCTFAVQVDGFFSNAISFNLTISGGVSSAARCKRAGITVELDTQPDSGADVQFTHNVEPQGAFTLDHDTDATHANNVTLTPAKPGQYRVTLQGLPANHRLEAIECDSDDVTVQLDQRRVLVDYEYRYQLHFCSCWPWIMLFETRQRWLREKH